uniref:Nucleoporin 54 n=1 Tax=Myotis myotis TaxID=51298 RepID=A0A7J8AM58_MYOMY|nr:hypothetical protein mMyoMyo1_008097 [Myotis myotis]
MAFNFGAPSGTAAATTAPTGGFGLFGTTATTADSAFSLSAPTNTGTTGLFGGTQSKGFGIGTGLGTELGFGGFNTQQQQQQQQTTLGGLFGQPTKAPAQSNQLINTANALSPPTLLGDERCYFAKMESTAGFLGNRKRIFQQ